MQATSNILVLDNFIGGRWTKAQTAEFFDVHNPAVGDVIGRTPLSSAADVDAAVRAAAAAFPAWRDTPVNTRAQVLHRLKALMEQHFEALARIVTTAVAGVDPSCMGLGPIPATQKALNRAGMTIDQIDLVELNEAFAAQAIACIRELKLDPDRVNIYGGAIALGHPLGATGARVLTTLVHALRRTNSRYGLATMCIGVGQGIAMIVERV